MRTASPKMSSLPILALLLFLLAHRTPPAQGNPLPNNDVIKLIDEMRNLLGQQPVLPKGDLQPNDIVVLRNKTLLGTNLEIFLGAAENFKNKTEKITKILLQFRTIVPTAPSTDDSFCINDWDDFRRKLKEYLEPLRKFVMAKNSA